MKRNASFLGLLGLLLLAAGWIFRPAPATVTTRIARSGEPIAQSVAAAKAFLATLDDSTRARISFPFGSEQKTHWSNLPTGIFRRNGVRLGDLTPPQREAAMHLLALTLSKRGYQKVQEIMNGDEVLKNKGGGMGGGRLAFSRDEYYFSLLGLPSLTDPWLLQFGGHHLALNITLVGNNQVLTPSLPAAQPAVYTLNGQTFRPLGQEKDKGLQLIQGLDKSQQQRAILPYQVSDLVLGPGQDGKLIQPEGIRASELTAAQQDRLLDVAHEWVGILHDEATAVKMAEIKANLADTWFAWSGPTDGSAAYFRIQGPTLLIEYAPQRQRGGGLDADHIHTIYRDPTNDYGAKLINR